MINIKYDAGAPSGKFDITVELNVSNALRSWKALQEKSKSFLLAFISISLSGICWEHCAHNTGHNDAVVRMSTTRWNNNAHKFFASDRYQNVTAASARSYLYTVVVLSNEKVDLGSQWFTNSVVLPFALVSMAPVIKIKIHRFLNAILNGDRSGFIRAKSAALKN